jgi:hypothetical protein
MKTLTYILIVAVLVGLIIPAAANARGHYRGGFSVYAGYYHPPYYGYGFGFRPFFHPFGYPYAMESYPNVIFETPVVIERPAVIVHRTAEPAQVVYEYTPAAKQSGETFANARNKKAELIRQLQSTDKSEKLKAITSLAGFTFDDQVREKLKDILLNDPNQDLRKEVANAFGKSNNEKVIPILEEAKAADINKEIQQEIDQAIKKLKGS